MNLDLKKRILEEGMKNIAKTEGVKLEINDDNFHGRISFEFIVPSLHSFTGDRLMYECMYSTLVDESGDVFKTIEDTRNDVKNAKNPMRAYIKADIEQTKELINSVYGINKARNNKTLPAIEKVIFNDPATIIFWKDGTKTVVKCSEDDEFNPEVGMAMAIAKKALGNKGNYCNEFKKWVEPFYEKQEIESSLMKYIKEATKKIGEFESRKAAELERAIFEASEESDKGFCCTCKYQHTLSFKDPCDSCLKAFNEDQSSPFWEPKD